MEKIDILSVGLYRTTRGYLAVKIEASGGSISRGLNMRLPDGHSVKNGHVVDGSGNIAPALDSKAQFAINKIVWESRADWRMYARCKWTFADAMQEFIKWREGRRENPKFEYHARKSIVRFGEMHISQIERTEAGEWIDGLADEGYADNTIKRTLDPPRALYNWLVKNEYWSGTNPFSGHEWKSTGTRLFIKPTVTAEEWQLIQNLS